MALGLETSTSNARRVIEQGGVNLGPDRTPVDRPEGDDRRRGRPDRPGRQAEDRAGAIEGWRIVTQGPELAESRSLIGCHPARIWPVRSASGNGSTYAAITDLVAYLVVETAASALSWACWWDSSMWLFEDSGRTWHFDAIRAIV